MRNARLNELQVGIKIGRRNISNLGYADDTTLVAESKEELKSLLMRMREKSEKDGLKLNIKKKNTIMAFNPISSLEMKGDKVEIVTEFLSFGSKIFEDGDCSHEIRRWLLFGRKAMTNLNRRG